MIILEDSIEINATPEKVFDCLTHVFRGKEDYQAWHPDHVDLCWIRGEPFEEGSIAYCEEYLHGEMQKFKARPASKIIKFRPSKQLKKAIN